MSLNHRTPDEILSVLKTKDDAGSIEFIDKLNAIELVSFMQAYPDAFFIQQRQQMVDGTLQTYKTFDAELLSNPRRVFQILTDHDII